jgi:hypothetical protein
MLTGPIMRVVEHRRRRILSAERPVVAHIDPSPPDIGLALRQDRYGRVVAMQALGREDMRLDPPDQRR